MADNCCAPPPLDLKTGTRTPATVVHYGRLSESTYHVLLRSRLALPPAPRLCKLTRSILAMRPIMVSACRCWPRVRYRPRLPWRRVSRWQSLAHAFIGAGRLACIARNAAERVHDGHGGIAALAANVVSFALLWAYRTVMPIWRPPDLHAQRRAQQRSGLVSGARSVRHGHSDQKRSTLYGKCSHDNCHTGRAAADPVPCRTLERRNKTATLLSTSLRVQIQAGNAILASP